VGKRKTKKNKVCCICDSNRWINMNGKTVCSICGYEPFQKIVNHGLFDNQNPDSIQNHR